MIVTLIPAAGASSRMRGGDKMLEPVGKHPALRHAALTALAADLGPVIVALRPTDQKRRKALRNLEVEVIEVPDAATGMSASLRAGARTAMARIAAAYPMLGDYEYAGMLVHLPDMPNISAEDLRRLNAAFQASGGSAMRGATQDGAPGHPVVFPDHMLHAFETLRGDQGAAPLLKETHVGLCPLGQDKARLDLDTPEAWAAWRTRLAPQR